MPNAMPYSMCIGGEGLHHHQPAMTTFKFLWNGIKVDNGSLQKASYSQPGSYAAWSGLPNDTITIYAKTNSGFSAEVWEAFDVANDSDTMTDYFEKDRIRVKPDHPLYQEVAKALAAQLHHWDKMQAKRVARRLAVAA